MYLIPADSTGNQSMTIRYEDDILLLTIRWNSIGQFWNMDIFDVETDSYIAQYMPLEVGTPIGQRLGRGWVFMLADTSSARLDPITADDLGTRCVLMIGTLAEALTLFGLVLDSIFS